MCNHLPLLNIQHLWAVGLHIKKEFAPAIVITRGWQPEGLLCSVKVLLTSCCFGPHVRSLLNWPIFQEWMNAFPVLPALEVLYEPNLTTATLYKRFKFRELVDKMRTQMPLIPFTAPQLQVYNEQKYVNNIC